MVSFLARALLALLLLGSARGDLRLAPESIEQTLDTAKLKLLAFSEGDHKITYQPPRGWDYSGSATLLTLRPRDKVQAQATVRSIPLTQPGNFEEEEIKKLLAEVISLLPKGSENINVISQEKNPLLINRKETLQISLSYSYYGQEFKTSILFLNREHEQMRFQLTAHASDFEELQRSFLQSHFTWQNL